MSTHQQQYFGFSEQLYAVLSLQNGDDVKTVQTNLGHASAAFTLDVYGHVSDRMQRESSDRMENYIKSLTGVQ